jgi:predicted phage terminase large subunit-like protein
MTDRTDIQRLLDNLPKMSHLDMANTLALLDELEERKRTMLAQSEFLAFIAAVDPAYKFGTHLKRLGALLTQVELGEKDRVAVSMAPRFGKSQMISIYYPAWYLGKHPDHKMIVASHTVDLAVDMARKVRNLMQTPDYKRIFPGVAIAADAKAAGKWNTTKGGEVYATGVGGALAGRGADLCLTPATLVETLERGFVPCGTVQVGESLRSWHGWAKVLKRITPEHSATVTVAGRLNVSAEHPIWTCNRGWVPAIEVVPTDILWTTSFWDRDVPRASPTGSTNEPQYPTYFSVQLGWLRRAGVHLLSRCGSLSVARKLRNREEGYLVRLKAGLQVIAGFLLGVRLAGATRIERHEARPFVNFMVDGDNTFVADTILTHNCIIDDPISEQDIKSGNTTSLDGVYDWFRNGLRTRLMPGGAIVILHTRWHQRDLIGRLLKDTALNEDGDKYDMFEFPAILETPNPLADPNNAEFDPDAPAVLQKSLWPEQWSLDSLLRTKASMPSWQWNAQYQQNPTAQEAAIIKRDHIKWWPHEKPPAVDYIVQSFDTALTTKTRSDYSVCQTWGVWKNEEDIDNVILLNCVVGKWEFPELKQMALQQAKDWEPDSIIVEAKASGQPLIDEMRRSGLFVQDYSPGKGQDKIARLNSVSDMFMSGQVWFPETGWATSVVEELLAFPSGEHDDQVDTLTLALIRIRKGGLLRLTSDHGDNSDFQAARKASYY